MTDEEAYQTPRVPLGIEAYERKLAMARYAMHRVRLTIYAQKVLAGQLTPDEGAEEYRKAMENFDQLMGMAENEPDRIEACVKDMESGFVVPEHPMWWKKDDGEK